MDPSCHSQGRFAIVAEQPRGWWIGEMTPGESMEALATKSLEWYHLLLDIVKREHRAKPGAELMNPNRPESGRTVILGRSFFAYLCEARVYRAGIHCARRENDPAIPETDGDESGPSR